MTRIAANASLTNQGRADLRRVPTGTQTDFNQNGDSSVSVVQARLIRLYDNFWGEPQFSTRIDIGGGDGRIFEPRSVCMFLWMTDRLTYLRVEQQYNNSVYPESGIGVPALGSGLRTNALAFPTNGMSALPAGTTCSLLAASEVGAQAVLAYGSGANALNVRGTPVLVRCIFNEYWLVPNAGQQEAHPTLQVSGFSESILSGKPPALFLTPVNGAFDAYSIGAWDVFREQVIMRAEDYVAGQYWLTGNQLVAAGFEYDIVGIYTEPLPLV